MITNEWISGLLQGIASTLISAFIIFCCYKLFNNFTNKIKSMTLMPYTLFSFFVYLSLGSICVFIGLNIFNVQGIDILTIAIFSLAISFFLTMFSNLNTIIKAKKKEKDETIG